MEIHHEATFVLHDSAMPERPQRLTEGGLGPGEELSRQGRETHRHVPAIPHLIELDRERVTPHTVTSTMLEERGDRADQRRAGRHIPERHAVEREQIFLQRRRSGHRGTFLIVYRQSPRVYRLKNTFSLCA
jgi:hypothetical protein